MRLLPLTLLCLLVFTGCTKRFEPSQDQIIADEIKQFYHWQNGSCWIMRDSATGNLDSFWLDNRRFYEAENVQEVEHMDFDIHVYPPSRKAITLSAEIIPAYNLFNFNGQGRDTILKSGNLLETPLRGGMDYFLGTKRFRNVYQVETEWRKFNPYSDPNATNYHLSLIMNSDDGLIRIRIDIPDFQHAWELVRWSIR